MGPNSNDSLPIQDWNQLMAAAPVNPYSFISDAMLGGVAGVFAYSTNYANTASWSPVTAALGAEPVCIALESDNLRMVADAASWNFLHRTANTAANVPPELRRYVFLRSNPMNRFPADWKMQIPLALGGAVYTDVQLSVLENAGNGLINTNSIPVVRFTGSFTGNVNLELTTQGYTDSDCVMIGIRLDTGTNVSMLVLCCKLIGNVPVGGVSNLGPNSTGQRGVNLPVTVGTPTTATQFMACRTNAGVATGCWSQNTPGYKICEWETGWYTITTDPNDIFTFKRCSGISLCDGMFP